MANKNLQQAKKNKNNLDYINLKFSKCNNYNTINVDKTADIPCDYDGVMGVPITFLDKYNPEQFEIVALGIVGGCNFTCEKKMEILDKNGQPTGKYTINAKGTLYKNIIQSLINHQLLEMLKLTNCIQVFMQGF